MNPKKILVFAEEHQENEARSLATAVKSIYPTQPYILYAFCVQEQPPQLPAFDHILCTHPTHVFLQDSKMVAACIEELHQQYLFDCVLFPASALGRYLAPRVAARLGVGLTADVTAIMQTETEVALVRPAYDGKLMAAIVNTGGSPLMASIRSNIFPPSDDVRQGQCLFFQPKTVSKSPIQWVATHAKPQAQDIRDMDVLVAGGGGIAQDFDLLEPLAQRLGGAVAASRRIVDQGIASRAIQVGQSGKIVSPKLYIAVGIYGSNQHIEGLKNVQHLICVNTNKNAPLCSLANIIVEGDGATFIRLLLQSL